MKLRLLLLTTLLVTVFNNVNAQDTDGDGISDATEFNWLTAQPLNFSTLTRGNVGALIDVINSSITNLGVTATTQYNYLKFSTTYTYNMPNVDGGAFNANPSGNAAGDLALGMQANATNTTPANYPNNWEQIVITFNSPVKVTIGPKSSLFGNMDDPDQWQITSSSNLTVTTGSQMAIVGGASGTTSVTISPTNTTGTATGWSVTTDQPVTSITLKFYSTANSSGNASTNKSPLNIKVDIPRDFDNDGTPDYKDLDSDGDGCSDQSEIAATSYYNTSVKSCIKNDAIAATKGKTSAASVLDNDLSSTGTQATSSNAKATATGTWPTGVTLNSNGTITVAATATPGVYNNLSYTLCSPPTGTPQYCTSSTVNLTVDINLPVIFDNVSAIISNGNIVINWATLTEINFDHFLVEISKDGVNWKVLDNVKSLAVDGNSNQQLAYSVTKPMADTVSLFGLWLHPLALLLLVLLTLPFIISFNKSFRHTRTIFAVLFAISLMGTVASCKKNNDTVSADAMSKVLVKITTVDKDGKLGSSNIIQAVQQ